MATRETFHKAGSPLTRRQVEIVQLRADGLTQTQAAARLGLHVTTCDDHLYNARLRLDARTPAHAVALALREGIIR